jgi:hypothetical protein
MMHSLATPEEPDAEVDAHVPPEPECDDGDPCTEGVAVDGECHFEPVPDGTPCDDGLFCTLGDHCRAGRCEPGPRSEATLEALGDLQGHYGAIAAVGPNRFVTYSARLRAGHLSLLERTEEGLSTVASWSGPMSIFTSEDARIVPFGGSNLVGVYNGSFVPSSMVIFSIGDNSIERISSVEVVLPGAGHGRRLWHCRGTSTSGLDLYDIDDPDEPALSLDVSGGCGHVAVSHDGSRVYATSQGAVLVVDAGPVDHGEEPVILGAVDRPVGAVPSFSSGHLLLRGSDDVRVFREVAGDPPVEEIALLPVAGVRSATLLGERLLVEGNREASGGTESFVALYDALGAGAPVLLDEVVLQRVPHSGASPTWLHSATDGQTLLTPVGARMFDIGDDALTEVPAPTLQPLKWLSLADGGGVHVHAPFGAVAVDVSDPEAPAFRGGGSFDTREWARLALADARVHPVLVRARLSSVVDFMASDRILYDVSPDPGLRTVPRWSLGDDASRSDEGSFALPLSNRSSLVLAGDTLVLGPATSDGEARWRGYDLPTLRRAGASEPSPIFDIRLSIDATPHFDVDPHAQVMVISGAEEGPDGEEEAYLVWLDLSTSPPEVIDEDPVPSRPIYLRVSGDRVVARSVFDTVFYERGRGEVARVTNDGLRAPNILAFDGEVAYYTVRAHSPAVTHELRAARFGVDEPPAVLPLDALPSSMVPTETGLVMGFEGHVLTVHPHCPRSEPPCVPVSCDEVGAQCGSIDDGCGTMLDCGNCMPSIVCTSNQCIHPN